MRAITFTEGPEGVWTNHETGVTVVRTTRDYEVRIPTQDTDGALVSARLSSQAMAKLHAKTYAGTMRYRIGQAYDEAHEMYAAERPGDFARHVIAQARQKAPDETPNLMAALKDSLSKAKAHRTQQRTAIEAYLAGETDELPPTQYREPRPLVLPDEIPDEAIAMNAGFDLAESGRSYGYGMTGSGKSCDDLVIASEALLAPLRDAADAFAENVRRYQR